MPSSVSPPSSPPLDPVAAISEDLTPLPVAKVKGDTDITFDGQLRSPLKLHEDVRTGCGGQTWPAGMLLGKHLLRYHRQDLEGARILELGAGGGLVGLGVAAECGVHDKLLISDQIPMLGLIKHNIQLNGLKSRAVSLELNWGDPLPQVVLDQKPNVIIAAECVYFEPAFPLLLQTLKDLLELNSDAVVYFCFKKRRRADMQFVKVAKKAFAVDELFDEDRPVFSRQSLFLFSFRNKIHRVSPKGASKKA